MPELPGSLNEPEKYTFFVVVRTSISVLLSLNCEQVGGVVSSTETTVRLR